MTPRVWPRSLAARTASVLLVGLIIVQAAGLAIHAFDRIDLQRLAQEREIAVRVMNIYRTVMLTPPDQREAVLGELRHSPDLSAELVQHPPTEDLPDALPFRQRLLRVNLNLVPLMGVPRWRGLRILEDPGKHMIVVGLHLPGEDWLNVSVKVQPPRPWHSPTFLAAFLLMTAVAAALTVWAVRRLTAPVRTLAAAADALGRDVNAPPLPEDGPLEVATAAKAFNTMASRIRRFVQDRTELLTAIGHDLRTPITRLKLRAEFVEDDEQRGKMLADLEELEAMVSATLAFGRDARTTEAVSSLDLAELLRTLLDEASDSRPDLVEQLRYEGPPHQTVRGRPLALKRALANLVSNAVNYGGGARLRLIPPADGLLVAEVEDDGPGIPPGELERVFEPFHRGEPSRSRETGGVGLGLPIARNIFRAHGGDVVLSNRPMGGVKATVTLPV
ncbi:MAG TPA: ATP-binding protein [Acetobacteraceae bacterium]|nr:ATP-binding protein [Acetobacteraceae bacterium]